MILKKLRVPLRNIIVSKNSRPTDKSMVNTFAFDIKRKGILVPLLVFKEKPADKRVKLADGLFRLEGFKQLNNKRPPSKRRKTIECYVLLSSDKNFKQVNEYTTLINKESKEFDSRKSKF